MYWKIIIPVIVFTAIIIFLIFFLNPSHRYNSISITENKWNSIKDARTENDNLVLEDIEFNDYNLIIDKNNNTLYYSLVNDSKNKYNPKVTYKTANKNVKIAVLLDEITDEKVKSNYKFKIMIYNETEYHIYNLVCTDLPLLNIKYNENLEDKQKNIPIEIYLFNNLSNTTNKITISSGKLIINDENLLFSLNKMSPGKNIRDNKISILNMKPNSEYILTAVTNNEAANIEEIENTKRDHKNHHVELFINNEYRGIYSLGYIIKNENK